MLRTFTACRCMASDLGGTLRLRPSMIIFVDAPASGRLPRLHSDGHHCAAVRLGARRPSHNHWPTRAMTHCCASPRGDCWAAEAWTVDMPRCAIAAKRRSHNRRCFLLLLETHLQSTSDPQKTGADTSLHRLFAPRPDHTVISVRRVRSLACTATPAEEGQRSGENRR
jgi:hypothetical protein